jgi:putative membrane protein
MSFKSKADNLVTKKMAGLERHFFTALLLAAYALVLTGLWRPVLLPGKSGWPEAVLLLLATVSTIAALARHLPLQNILFAAFAIALAAAAATWLDLKTGIPFGQFTTGDNAGPKLFTAVPWALPLVWIAAILNSRGVARLVLRPWRKTHTYGFWLIGVTAALTVLFDLALDPFASQVKHYWYWEPTKFHVSWQGAPLVNFFGWLVVTLLILAFVTPILINKNPVHRRPPDFHPLGVWLGGVLLFGIGSASLGLWSAVLLDGIIGVVVVIFAVRGARW